MKALAMEHPGDAVLFTGKIPQIFQRIASLSIPAARTVPNLSHRGNYLSVICSALKSQIHMYIYR